MCQSLFFNKVAGLKLQVLLKRDLYLSSDLKLLSECLRETFCVNVNLWDFFTYELFSEKKVLTW